MTNIQFAPLLLIGLTLSLYGCPNNENNQNNDAPDQTIDAPDQTSDLLGGADASIDASDTSSDAADESSDTAVVQDSSGDQSGDAEVDTTSGEDDVLVGADLTVTGTINGSLPDDTELIVVWSVSSGRDYAYVWGSGKTSGNTFSVKIPESTPDMSILNRYDEQALGLALVIAIKPGAPVPPQGTRLEDAELSTVGQTSNHGLIYNGLTEGFDDFSWPLAFPFQAFSCGVGEELDDTSFDVFKPTACSSMVLEVTDELSWVNWT